MRAPAVALVALAATLPSTFVLLDCGSSESAQPGGAAASSAAASGASSSSSGGSTGGSNDGGPDDATDAPSYPAPYSETVLDKAHIGSDGSKPDFQKASGTLDFHDGPFAEVKLVV